MARAALPPDCRLVALDSVDSTNEEAKRRAREGAPDKTLIWAAAQSAGRGRGGRTWVSPPGNLYLSLVLRPDCPARRAAELGFVAAVALGAALHDIAADLPVAFKWPNDVLLRGRKLAGISVETLRDTFAGHLLEATQAWQSRGFGPVRERWKALAAGIGSIITVRLPNASLRGTFVDLDADGALLLRSETDDGAVRRITAGDVFFG